MFGLSIMDLVVIVAYFIIIVWIGLRAMKHIKNEEDYFLGGRRFGKIVQIFTIFGQGTSTDTAVGTTSLTYSNGASGIWSQLSVLFTTPIYWFTAPWYRRMRCITLGDFFSDRFASKKLAGFYSIMAAFFMISIISVGLKSMAVTVQGVTLKSKSELTSVEQVEYRKALELENLKEIQSTSQLSSVQLTRLKQLQLEQPQKHFSFINQNLMIFIVCIIILLYAITGGLEAAMYTDTLQGILTFLLSITVIPFGLYRLNQIYNMSGLMDTLHLVHQKLPEWYFEIFGSPYATDFTWYFIATMGVLMVVNVAVQPNQLNSMGSAKDEDTARIGCIVGNYLKRFCIVLWSATGLIALALYFGVINDPDIIWGNTVHDLLGPLGIGLVGLMIACLMAALMSSADMMMITASGLITKNIYQPLFPNKSDKHYVLVGRISGAVVLLFGAVVATYFETILQLLKFTWEINTVMVAAFWCGMLWRRANKFGAWTSMAIATLFFCVCPIALPSLFPSLSKNPSTFTQTKIQTIKAKYEAKEIDIAIRKKEIQKWNSLSAVEKEKVNCPKTLNIGDKFTKNVVHRPKSIYWSKGIKSKNGIKYGDGLFYFEMYLLDKCFDLSKNPYALNETIRMWIRIIFPFLVMIIISLLTKPDDKKVVDRFYVKMRTPVIPDHDLDRQEMLLSYSTPDRFIEKKMFPNSNIEVLKWRKIDFLGFGLSVCGVFVVLGFLYFVVNIGGNL